MIPPTSRKSLKLTRDDLVVLTPLVEDPRRPIGLRAGVLAELARRGLAPGYEQKTFTEADKRGRLRLVASPDGADDSVTIHQDARVYATRLGPGEEVEHKLAPGRHAWVQVTRGALTAGGQRLAHGDGAAISGEPVVKLAGEQDAEALLFDLP